MLKKGKKGIVYVGLSGGVDSSVSAALLKQAGFIVHGVFIKVWQPNFWGGCTMQEDRLDAMRVCAKLDIPFHTLDLEKEYKKEVVDYMLTEYQQGQTPNPDVMCNKYIKFGGFFDWAMKQGADYVATGHYARIKENKGRYEMRAGRDKNKDQSYFLWTLTQKQIAKTFFPVGNLEKPAVRKLAQKFGLSTAEKKDSQGICFIGKVEMVDFLKHFIPGQLGPVLDEKGQVIGRHDGAVFYTLGQRHGFTVTKKTTTETPYFIIKKDLKNNTLTVSHSPFLEKGNCIQVNLKNINWTFGQEPDLKKTYSARIRYRQPLEKCQIIKDETGEISIEFKKNQKAPTPGQSVVIYDEEVCLGGGIIV